VKAKLCGVEQMALPMFGRATITLGIGPHFLVQIMLSFTLKLALDKTIKAKQQLSNRQRSLYHTYTTRKLMQK